MPEITEVLTQVEGEAFTFVVNTAVESVPLIAPVGPALGYLINPNGSFWFDKGEGFQLLSLGYKLPHNFVMGQIVGAPPYNETRLQLRFETGLGASGEVPIFATGGVFLPFENYELAVDVFADMAFLADRYRLIVQFVGDLPQVSMLNVPASINTNTYAAPVFLKLLHTNPLT